MTRSLLLPSALLAVKVTGVPSGTGLPSASLTVAVMVPEEPIMALKSPTSRVNPSGSAGPTTRNSTLASRLCAARLTLRVYGPATSGALGGAVTSISTLPFDGVLASAPLVAFWPCSTLILLSSLMRRPSGPVIS